MARSAMAILFSSALLIRKEAHMNTNNVTFPENGNRCMTEREYIKYCKKIKARYARFHVPAYVEDRVGCPLPTGEVLPVTYQPAIKTIFRLGFRKYMKTHTLSGEQKKAGAMIALCGTPSMGILAQSKCSCCGTIVTTYNHCGNRNCTCGAAKRKEVEDKLVAEDYPCRHYHIVFQIPAILRPLFWLNQKELYSVLFNAACHTVIEISEDEKYLGTKPGIVAVLHTWNQLIDYHPHIHVVCMAGGLDDNNKFVTYDKDKDFYIPVKVLQEVFKGKLISEIIKLISKQSLTLPKEWKKYTDQNADFIDSLKSKLYSQEWDPYIKNTDDNPDIMEYLARYINKVAIGDSRILEVTCDSVTIQYRDSADHCHQKVAVMSIDEFIGRYLMHVLPSGFQKIRHSGVLANNKKKQNLALIRAQVGTEQIKTPKFNGMSLYEISKALWGKYLRTCPKCKHGILNTYYVADPKYRKPKWKHMIPDLDSSLERAAAIPKPMQC